MVEPEYSSFSNFLSSQKIHPKQLRFFYFLFLGSALMLGWVLWPFWQILILAFLLSGVFRPVYKKLNLLVSPWLASLISCLLIFLIVFIPLFFCVITISQEAGNLLQFGKETDVLLKLQDLIQNNTLFKSSQDFLAGFGIHVQPPDMPSILSQASKSVGLFMYTQISSWAANIMSFVLRFLLVIIVSYFIFLDMDKLIDFIVTLSPLPTQHSMLLMDNFTRIAGVILIGNGLSCIIQGTLCGLLFSALDISAPVLWGFIMGVLAFIPILGIGFVLLPTAAIFLINGHTGQAIATLLAYLFIHYSIELFLKPKFVGSQLKMHALLVLLAILGGISLFGVLGIIFGPLIISLFFTLYTMYQKEYCDDRLKDLPAEDDSEAALP